MKTSENMDDIHGPTPAGAELEALRQPYQGLSALEIIRDVLRQEQQFTTALHHALTQLRADLDAERQAHARVRAALEAVIHHVRTPGPLNALWDAVYAADAVLAAGSGEAGG